jgi:hypothetical protein
VRPRATTILILALAAGLAAGCGGDDEGGEPIPPDQAAALQRQLESIENRFQVGGGACADITGNSEPNTTEVRSVIDSLPQDVDSDVRDSLEQSFQRLFELVQEQCDTEKGQEEEPPSVETETTETVPPPTDDEEEDDEGEEEEAPPPEEGPTATEPPTEVPPEGPTGTTGQGGTGDLGQGGSGSAGQGGGGSVGQGGGGSAGQGGGGGALVPGDTVP